MARTWLVALVGLIMVAGVGGIAFAQWTSTATVNGSVTAGTFTLAWEFTSPGPAGSGIVVTPSPAGVTCGTTSASNTPPASWTLGSTTSFQPPDSCTYTNYIEDTGNLPGSLTTGWSWVMTPAANAVGTCPVDGGGPGWETSITIGGPLVYLSTAVNSGGATASVGSISAGVANALVVTIEFSLDSLAPSSACMGSSLTLLGYSGSPSSSFTISGDST